VPIAAPPLSKISRSFKFENASLKLLLKAFQSEAKNTVVINAHYTWPSGYLAVRLKELYGIPVVVTGHGFDVYDLPFRSASRYKIISALLKRADHVVTVSRRNVEILVNRLGVDPGKISVIYNGYDEKKFKPIPQSTARRALQLPADKRIVLNVANLVPVKGHIYLIQAFKKVVETVGNALLVIVGGGPLRSKLEKYAKKLGLSNSVVFAGSRPHDEIPLWMNAADLLVLSSISEGCPVVVFEAMGVGLPIVATSVGGVPEVIVSDELGYLCQPRDVECLAQNIVEGFSREWDRERILQYARRYTWSSIAREYVEVFNRVVSRKL